MLAALRTNKGWPRAIALVLLLAFSAGVLHMHANAAFASAAVVVSDTQDGHGHDHEGAPAPGVTSHCAFCALVAGKFYLSADMLDLRKVEARRIMFLPVTSQLSSLPPSDLFRPPIALLG